MLSRKFRSIPPPLAIEIREFYKKTKFSYNKWEYDGVYLIQSVKDCVDPAI